MPEISLLHIGAATFAAIVGIVIGWLSRGSRAKREKAAINAGWQEQLEAKNVEGGRLATQNKNLMEQVSRFQNSDHSATRQVKELSAALKDGEERRVRLDRQVDGLRSQLKRATDDLNQLNIELKARPGNKKPNEAVAADQEKVAALSKSLKEWQSRVPPLMEKFRERDEAARALEAELAEARERIAALESGAQPEALDDATDTESAIEPRNNEPEGNVVSIAERQRAQAAAAETDAANAAPDEDADVLEDESDSPAEGEADIEPPGDVDLLDAGESLDSQIEEAAAAESDADDDEQTLGTRRMAADPVTGSFAAASDDDTGQSRFDGGRTRVDADSVFSPADDEVDAQPTADLIPEDELLEDGSAEHTQAEESDESSGDSEPTEQAEDTTSEEETLAAEPVEQAQDGTPEEETLAGDPGQQARDETSQEETLAGDPAEQEEDAAAQEQSLEDDDPGQPTQDAADSGEHAEDGESLTEHAHDESSDDTQQQEVSDLSMTTEGPAVARQDPAIAGTDVTSGAETATTASGAHSLDFGAYVDYPEDEQSDGLRDNLKRINGIGPAIEKTLNELGFFRYRQIADLTDYDIDRIDKKLDGFRARIYREDWMGQARKLLDHTAGETA